MLPRRLTIPPRPPAKLNPSLSHSCELFFAPQKVNARQINNFRTLLAKHTGWGVPSIHSLLARPTLPYRVKSRASSYLQPLWPLFALFFNLPFFIFNSLRPLFPKHPGWGVCASRSPLRGPCALCASALSFGLFPIYLATAPVSFDFQLSTVDFHATMLKSTRHRYDHP